MANSIKGAQERVDISIPRGSDREDPNLFVAINGKNYLLPRGKRSSVPPEVAREIERSERLAHPSAPAPSRTK